MQSEHFSQSRCSIFDFSEGHICLCAVKYIMYNGEYPLPSMARQ